MAIERSGDLFRSHRRIWKYCGLIHPKKHRTPYYIWLFILHFGVTFFYPFHLILGLLEVQDKKDIFQNLSINFTDLICSLKFILIWWNVENIWHIERILSHLDDRIRTAEQKLEFQGIVRRCRYVFYVFGVLYVASDITLELSTVISDERRLIYPAWLPIDWRKSSTNYWIANMYQYIGVTIQIFINYANDTYPPISLAVLSGHIRLLAMRLTKLGTNPRISLNDNNKELKRCIRDHKLLIEVYLILNKVLSKGMFLQVIGTGFNICCTIMYLLFYANNLVALIYYSILFTIYLVQIFPSCYFGTVFETEFNNLPYAMFSNNWVDQDREFKLNIIIFSQRSMKTASFFCMGFFKIHLDTFFSTIKSAYSLFAVILRTK